MQLNKIDQNVPYIIEQNTSPQKITPPFLPLPKGVTYLILGYVTTNDLLNVRMVCKHAKELADYQLELQAKKWGYFEDIDRKNSHLGYIKTIFLIIKRLKNIKVFKNAHYFPETTNIDQLVDSIARMRLKKVTAIFGNASCYVPPAEAFHRFMCCIYLKKFLLKNSSVSSKSALAFACKNHSATAVTFLEKIGTSPNFSVYSDNALFSLDRVPFLIYLISVKNFFMAERVLSFGNVNIHVKARGGCSAIHFAACVGWNEGLLILLKKGACIDEKTFHRCTPLSFAAENNHYLTVKLLLEKGANPNILNMDGIAPIEVCSSENKEIINILLEYGANPRKHF